MKRVFLGVLISTTLQEKIERYIAQQKMAVRWIKPENWHLTLYFIGDLTNNSIDWLASKLEDMQQLSKFELSFDKISFAPFKRQPTMIWALYKINPKFNEFVAAIYSSLKLALPDQAERFQKPPLPNYPHLTLARFKDPSVSKQKLSSIKLPDLLIDRFQLIESELTPTGSVYKVLNEYHLQN